MSGLAAVLVAAGLAIQLPWRLPWPLPTPHLPTAVERWLYNPRERTERAMAESKQGKDGRKRAVEDADTALRLAPDDPLVQYDGGTARLAGDDAKSAAPLLDRAAQALARRGDVGRAAAAHYNLGNARLSAGDAAAAVEAFKQALREAPGDRDAKWNLELALRERAREQARARSPREGDRGDKGGGHENTPKGGGAERPGDQKSGANAGDPGKGQPQQQGGEGEKQGEQGQGGAPRSGRQLQQPRFHDLPEMSAAEASSILESVENLERQQRRAQAAENARRRTSKVRDW
jgi:Ca-activated chloride channel family protein